VTPLDGRRRAVPGGGRGTRDGIGLIAVLWGLSGLGGVAYVHNAWDNVTYNVFVKRRERRDAGRDPGSGG
jgi:hypothetical protein